MKRLIIVGSPRIEGRSGALADLLFESCIEQCPEDEVFLAPVSTLDISGCTACDFCKRKAKDELTEREQADEEAFEAQRAEDQAPHRCVIRDDVDDIYPLLEDADELIVVAPVFFAGPSSQLKALLDRFQPYFWTRMRARRRPATLHVVGEGGDPHGFDPLVGVVRSAAAVAGFRLERVLDWVGKIDESGEIVAEADECPVTGPVVRVFAGGASADSIGDAEAKCAGEDKPDVEPSDPGVSVGTFAEGDFAAQLASQAARRQNRARLDLGSNGSERQVIKLDEDGKRIDDARRGRKRANERKSAKAKRGTSGVQQAQNRNPHAKSKDSGSSRGGSASGRGSNRGKGAKGGKGSNQGRRRG